MRGRRAGLLLPPSFGRMRGDSAGGQNTKKRGRRLQSIACSEPTAVARWLRTAGKRHSSAVQPARPAVTPAAKRRRMAAKALRARADLAQPNSAKRTALGPDEVSVEALSLLPRGLASVVDESLVCSICTEVRPQGQRRKDRGGVQLTLSACSQVLHLPVNGVACPHVFCEGCLTSWSRRFHSPPCPLCRTPLRRTVPDATSTELLATTSVSCTCGEAVLLSRARAHAASCAHVGAVSEALLRGGAQPKPQPSALPNRLTFSCPLCPPGQMGTRDAPSLAEHVQEAHAGSTQAAVCPICSVQPWGDPTYVSRNWVAHVTLRHRYELQGFADVNAEEEEEDAALVAALRASALEAGLSLAAGGEDEEEDYQ